MRIPTRALALTLAAAAFGIAAPASAMSCAELKQTVEAHTAAQGDVITAAVASELEKVSTRASERFAAMETRVAAGEMSTEEAQAAFAELEQQAETETDAVNAWAEGELLRIQQEAEADFAEGMKSCTE